MNRRLLVTIVIVGVAVVLAIVLDTILSNHRPAIIALEADAEKVTPSGTCQIACNASDSDNDELSYNWSASGGEINGVGAVVTWTAPGSEGSYNVAVTVADNNGGEVEGYVTIEVRANQPPEITNIAADRDWAVPRGNIQVICTAWDPDEDVLSYEWIADGGDISGTGANVTWTAPEEIGTYNITVVVKDGYGGQDIEKLHLSVNLGTPPSIEKLCITPEGHTYLRYSSTSNCDFDIWKNRDYCLECFAAGTGELVYEWSQDDAVISEEGSTIIWTAPNKQSTTTVSVDTAITVIVSDSAGNSVGKAMILHIPTCTCGSWRLESGCK